MPYRIAYSKDALKALRRMPRDLAQQIRVRIEGLKTSPYEASNVKKLSGYEDTYRLRVRDWRVVYTVDDGTVTISVLRIAPRGGVYQ